MTRFEQYLAAMDIQDKKRKRALLVYLSGKANNCKVHRPSSKRMANAIIVVDHILKKLRFPAKGEISHICGNANHFAKLCQSRSHHVKKTARHTEKHVNPVL